MKRLLSNYSVSYKKLRYHFGLNDTEKIIYKVTKRMIINLCCIFMQLNLLYNRKEYSEFTDLIKNWKT